ncbi:Gfo/Idh/MocA family oxidoreductase [Rheinheimera texasensis]|uniref:Gfo/Idh/MocA family oxidoreductase n=1 Tax=Rheinheimera texasensis TaxID=306205 RepID=UPI0004E26A05|nr:Gfo/Idh/MocA family oxidoreductase [Rheinheimera texasensis]
MIKTAVIGFGLSARVFHLPFIASNTDFKLVGISTSQQEAAECWPDVQIYADAASLIEHTDASLIVITAPNRAHFSLAKAALLAGKDVLVEKPLAVTVTEANELQQLATQQQRKLAVYHNRRFDDDFVALQQLLQSGRLGTVQLMYSRFDRFRPQVQQRWKESAEPGNGVLYDLAPHLLDQAIALFGAPDQITASCQSLRDGGSAGAVDYFQLRLDYLPTAASPGKAAQPPRQLVLSSSPYCAHPAPRFELHGSGGSFISSGLDPQEQILRDALQQSPAKPTAVFTSARWQQRQQARRGKICDAAGCRSIAMPQSDYAGFYQQLGLFLHDRGAAPVPLADAVLGLQLMELALQSSREQRTLALSAAKAAEVTAV